MTGVIITLVDVSHNAWRELHIQFPNAIRVPAGGGLTVVEAKNSTEALRVLAYAFPDLREVETVNIVHPDDLFNDLIKAKTRMSTAPTAAPRGWTSIETPDTEPTAPRLIGDTIDDDIQRMRYAVLSRAQEATDAEPTRVFTFGTGHRHPITGESLGQRYVRVPGDAITARERMLSVFGREWSHEYADLSAASRDGRFKLNPISPRPVWLDGSTVSWVA